MARQVKIELLGDARSLQRSFEQSARASEKLKLGLDKANVALKQSKIAAEQAQTAHKKAADAFGRESQQAYQAALKASKAQLGVRDATLKVADAQGKMSDSAHRARAATDQVQQSTERVQKTAGRATERWHQFGSSLRSVARTAALAGSALVGAFALTTVISSVKGFVAAARESQAIAKQTAAVIKSTGGAAKLSAQGFADLAAAISKKVAVDDDLIQGGENILATFTGVRNEVGKGNDIFNQATVAAVDLTAAMNQGQVTAEGLKSANIQLGKALNDPIKGITALTRVGVTFTQKQKDQIKSLVEHGDKLGAQKIILAELAKEFGGSAAASVTASKSLGVAWGNIQELLGGVLIPILDKIASWLSTRLPGAIKFTTTALGALVGAFQEGDITSTGFVGAMERIGVVARTVVMGVKALGGAFREGDVTSTGFVGVMEKIGVAARAVADWFTTKVIPAVRTLLPFLREMATSVGGALVDAFRSLQPGLRSLLDGMQRLWPIVQVGLKVWAAYLFILWSKVIPAIIRIAGPVLGGLFKALGLFITWMSNVVRWIGLGITWLARFVTGTKTTQEAVKVAGQRIQSTWTAIRDTIGAVVSFILRVLRVWVDAQFDVVASILHVMGKLPGPMGAPFREAEKAVRKAKGTIDTKMDEIQRRIDKLRGKDVTVTALAAVKASPVVVREGVRVGLIRGFAAGGLFRGRGTGTSDSNLAMVSDGEFWVNARATAKHRPLLEAINEDRMPRYATGGLVGDRPIERTQRASERLAVNAATQIALRAAAKLAQVASTALGNLAGPGGWQWQMRVLRAAFPGLALISGYRPGAITATGRRSYHASGRAVDVPPSMAVFNWIRSHYGRNTKELIFSPAGGRQIHNGSPHYYTGITRAMHFNHVHWAYRNGGTLPEDVFGMGKSGATYSMHRGETVTPRGTGAVTIEKGAVQVNVYGAPGQSEERLFEIMDARLHQSLSGLLGPVRSRRGR